MVYRTLSILFAFLCLSMGLVPRVLAASTEKIDPSFLLFPSGDVIRTKALSKGAHSKATTEAVMVEAFIRTDDPHLTADAIRGAGGAVGVILPHLITASFPSSELATIADRDEVHYIEAAKPLSPSNDIAATEVNGLEVHRGIGLPTGFTGSGVVIGIVDTGIDLSHPDFLDAEGNSRILAVWDQRNDAGPGPSEITRSYGTECDHDMILNDACSMEDVTGHGTHIAGTAAGRHEKYGGIAPDANIIAVRYRSEVAVEDGYAEALFSTTICESCSYIFKKAAAMGMPAVCNLSLGTHLGAHDGTSLFEQCLDGLVEDPSASLGRVVVAAAGNENVIDPVSTGLHAALDVNDTTQAVNFIIRDLSAGNFFYIDLWGMPGDQFEIALALHEGLPDTNTLRTTTSFVKLGESASGALLHDRIDYTINAGEIANPLNDKPHVGIALLLDNSIHDPKRYSFDLILRGRVHADAWGYPDKPATAINFTTLNGDRDQTWTYVSGDNEKSIAIPATAGTVIAVAGYSTRDKWVGGEGCCRVDFEVGKILPFSSRGPAASDAVGIKPDIAAPGAMIASARSRDMQVNNLLVVPDSSLHYFQAGTSMAAPFISGTAALMFSAHPTLRHTDIKRYVTAHAYVDDEVGEAPNAVWGYGKLDVLAAVTAAVEGGPSDMGVTPSESADASEKSGSGCSINTHASPYASPLVWLLIFSAAHLVSSATIKYRNITQTRTARDARASA